MQIRDLFDRSKGIDRKIEKVITYGVSQETRLKSEITEYVVTESIEDQFEQLLTRMHEALEMGDGNEIGVWVSGFYGSGKSSFTKYLGLALDKDATIEGTPFLKFLQDRFEKPQTKSLLASLAHKQPAAVIFLDLAAEMLAGSTMEEVSTVLFFKVLQWAGFSRNIKVAAFERRLQKDGLYEEFKEKILKDSGVSWKEVQNDPLVIDSIIPDIAHEMYPNFFKTPSSFNTDTEDFVLFENERVKEMLDIVREKTGKKFVVFIIDEVGQYIGSRPNLILNIDGLAKNLKALGEGNVWIIATAQQTLTEDDPRAAINSPELFKLQARFPIQIDLESSDIKEICYRRLLAKSPDGQGELGGLFDQHGQSLRHNIKLKDARYYDNELDKVSFVNLYPFLPSHFDILLQLLGVLAKSTGGIGLRSAIKVVQDILVEGPEDDSPVANRPVGWLATAGTIYDALEKDIYRASRKLSSIHSSVSKVRNSFPESIIHFDVAKTVAILQILENIPATPQNIACLLHPTVDAQTQKDKIEMAISDLIKDPVIPFGEKDGNLCFFSERLNDIDKEKGQIPIRSIETRRIKNEVLKNVFTPLPSVRMNGTLSVTAGLKTTFGTTVSSLAGERETIQFQVEFEDPSNYEVGRTRLVDESRVRNSQSTIYILGRSIQGIEDITSEIYRSREIVQRYRTSVDSEIKNYCSSQSDREARLMIELENILKKQILQGSFIFRGQTTAVESIDPELIGASKKFLGDVAEQVFDRYEEAPIRAETDLAEKFLRIGNLKAVTSSVDPLGFVQISGGSPSIRTDHKALISVRDYIDRLGSVEGKRMMEHFSGAPFGWSTDTLRYIVAVMLTAGEIKLKLSGRDVTVVGQQAIDALRTNNSFKSVGVSLREERPSPDILVRAAGRLTDLLGDQVIPLEDEISRKVREKFPDFQYRFGPLAEKLHALGLYGSERVRVLNEEIKDILLSDASDSPIRLGSEESPLFEGLNWANEVDLALKNGLEKTVRDIQKHRADIEELPTTGIPGKLREDLAEVLDQVKQRLSAEDFFLHQVELSSKFTMIESDVKRTAVEMIRAQKLSLTEMANDLQRMVSWAELGKDEQSEIIKQIEQIEVTASEDIAGIKKLLQQSFDVQGTIDGIRRSIESTAKERKQTRLEEKLRERRKSGFKKLERSMGLPSTVSSHSDLEDLIGEFQNLKEEAVSYEEFELTFRIED